MKILSAIACEDIRQEKNNKHILIGVFGPDISVSEMPGTIVLRYFVQLLPDELRGTPHFKIEISQKYKNGTKKLIARGSAELQKRESAAMTVATPQIPIQLDQPCEIRFRLREDGKRWKTALVNSVKVDPTLSSPLTTQTPKG